MAKDQESISKPEGGDCSAASSESSVSSLEESADNSSCSNDSSTFKDISFADDKPANQIHTDNTSTDICGTSATVALDPRLKMIYSTVMETLNRDLRPQIQKLANDSVKYHTLRSVYHLPSITDLKKELMRQNAEGIQVNLDINSAQLLGLINKAAVRTRNSSFRNSVGSNRMPKTRMNTGLKESLSAIPEKRDVEDNHLQLRRAKVKYIFLSQVQSYERSRDQRDIRDLDTKELEIILKRINSGTFPDLKGLRRIARGFKMCCGIKEQPGNEYILKEMDNKELKLRILELLHNSQADEDN